MHPTTDNQNQSSTPAFRSHRCRCGAKYDGVLPFCSAVCREAAHRAIDAAVSGPAAFLAAQQERGRRLAKTMAKRYKRRHPDGVAALLEILAR